MKKKSNRKNIIFSLILALLGAVPLFWFKSDFIVGGDFYFPLSNTRDIIINYCNVWLDLWGTGFVNARAIAQLPFIVLISKAVFCGFTLQLCERILFFLLFACSGIGMFWLVDCLPIKKNRDWIAFFAALFYMFNPFNIVFYWHIIDGMIFVYVNIVLSLLFYLKWFLTKNNIYGVLFLSLSLVAGYAYSNPLVIPMTWGLLFLFHFIIILPDWNVEIMKKSGYFYLKAMGLWILFNAWWLFPLFGSLRSEYSGLSASVGTPWDTLRAFSLKTSLLNIFRFSDLYWAFGKDSGGVAYYTYAGMYNSIIFKLISMLIPFCVFFPLLLKRTRTLFIVSLSFLTLICMFLVKGIYPPGGELLYKLLFKIPFMPAFRAPIHKLGVLLSINYAILFGCGISCLYDIICRRSKLFAKTTIAILLFLIFGVYAYPIWTGEVIHKGDKGVASFHVKVPAYYNDAKEFFYNKEGVWRFYSLPQCPTFNVSYDWEEGYIATDPSFSILAKQGIYATVEESAQRPYILLRDTDSKDMYKLLQLMTVKYLVLHHDVNGGMWDLFTGKYKSVSYIKQRVSEQKNIDFVQSFGKLDVYKLDDNYFLPHIYSSNTPKFILSDLDIVDFILGSKENSLKPLIIQTEDQSLLASSVELSEHNAKKEPLVTFKKINPSKYTLILENVDRSFWLIFNESFHKKWRLFKNLESKVNIQRVFSNIIAEYPKLNVKEVKYISKLTPGDIKFMFQQPLKAVHYKANMYANAWYIEPDKLGLGNEFVLDIYFSDQNYFYLGFFVSILMVCCWISIFFIKGYYRRNKNAK